MNPIKTCYARIYQKILYVAVYILHVKQPKVIHGKESAEAIEQILKEKNIDNCLLVVDDGLFKLPMTQDIINNLSKKNIRVSVFHNFQANPTIKNVEEGLEMYKNNKHTAIVGLGGGSSLDTAKMIGARASNPKKSVEQLKGLLKIRHKLPLLIAIPTTAGTGSETTLAAVIVNEKTHHKYAVNDPKLVPIYAILDPSLLVNLPGKITSTTGMDALTHALEAYTNHARTKNIKKHASTAMKLIKENLVLSYQNPKDLKLRENMQIASYDAGVAFTTGYVGYVHALAHALGGQYNIPHGLANALILPIVMEAFGKSAFSRLANVYDYIELGDKNITKEEKAKAVIAWIRALNNTMDIHFDLYNTIKEEDLPKLVENAYREAYPLYPCPRMFDRNEIKNLFLRIKEENK